MHRPIRVNCFSGHSVSDERFVSAEPSGAVSPCQAPTQSREAWTYPPLGKWHLGGRKKIHILLLYQDLSKRDWIDERADEVSRTTVEEELDLNLLSPQRVVEDRGALLVD